MKLHDCTIDQLQYDGRSGRLKLIGHYESGEPVSVVFLGVRSADFTDLMSGNIILDVTESSGADLDKTAFDEYQSRGWPITRSSKLFRITPTYGLDAVILADAMVTQPDLPPN